MNTISNTYNISKIAEEKASLSLKPLPFAQSIFLFAIPALVMMVTMHIIYPSLVNSGFTGFKAMVVTYTVPMALMFAAAFAGIALEAGDAKPQILKRFRLDNFSWKDIAWGIGLFVAVMSIQGIFIIIGQSLIDAGIIPLPESIPLLQDPNFQINDVSALNVFVGGQLQGNWSVVALYFVMLFFNIIGEELWWRGYILPRQELVFGRWTWLVHGLMWCSFHIFIWWKMIMLLPVCLVIAWIAQRRKSTWASIIIHYLFNGIAFIAILMGVLGIL